jgi:hypothetical protein
MAERGNNITSTVGIRRMIQSVRHALRRVAVRALTAAMLAIPAVLPAAEQLEPIDPKKRDHYGELYDPRRYKACREEVESIGQFANTRCDVYKLRRQENPEYWPYPNVPPPKLPPAYKDSGYKPWMTSKQYFEHLCKTEAGEFIYRTVENVEGIYQIRPRKRERDEAQHDRFVLEDPVNYSDWEANNPEAFFVRPSRYAFFETASSIGTPEVPGARYHRFTWVKTVTAGAGYKHEILAQEKVSEIQSRYGYAWRGIFRPRDRELGIAGGELIVLDLRTNEVLAIQRGFIQRWDAQTGLSKLLSTGRGLCPSNGRRLFKTVEFLLTVLRPVNWMAEKEVDKDATK